MEKKIRQNSTHTTGWATRWYALWRAHPAPVDHREEWFWCRETVPTGGGSSWRASMVRTWWAARSSPGASGPHSLVLTFSLQRSITSQTLRRTFTDSRYFTPFLLVTLTLILTPSGARGSRGAILWQIYSWSLFPLTWSSPFASACGFDTWRCVHKCDRAPYSTLGATESLGRTGAALSLLVSGTCGTMRPTTSCYRRNSCKFPTQCYAHYLRGQRSFPLTLLPAA